MYLFLFRLGENTLDMEAIEVIAQVLKSSDTLTYLGYVHNTPYLQYLLHDTRAQQDGLCQSPGFSFVPTKHSATNISLLISTV